MLVRPAVADDAETLFSWWHHDANSNQAWNELDWFWSIVEGAAHTLLIAEQRGEKVGSLIVEPTYEMRWTIAPQHRQKGLAKRMVGLVAEPVHFALIDRSDVASRTIAEHAGFDLAVDGTIQVWRAIHATPYV